MKLIICTLLTFNFTNYSHAQIVSTYDASIAGVGVGGYMIYKSMNESQNLNALAFREIVNLETDLKAQSDQMASLLDEAKLVEAGKPVSNRVSLYTGRFINAADYNQYAGEARAMNDQTFRMQDSGVKTIEKALKNDSRFDGEIKLRAHRVAGTRDGSVRMSQAIEYTGTIDEVISNLAEAVQSQSKTQTQESIVKVEVEFKTVEKPNPVLAKSLRVKADELGAKVKTGESEFEKMKQDIEKKYGNQIRRLKNMRRIGAGLIGTAIVFGYVRHSFAQNILDLTSSCDNGEALNTHATAVSLSTGQDKDEVAAELQKLCGKLK